VVVGVFEYSDEGYGLTNIPTVLPYSEADPFGAPWPMGPGACDLRSSIDGHLFSV
jgi:hypothetical protein